MNLQTYSEDNFLSLELVVGGQIWKVIKMTPYIISNSMYLAKDAQKQEKEPPNPL